MQPETAQEAITTVELLQSLSKKVDELSEHLLQTNKTAPKFGGVELACQITGYKPTYIYKLVFQNLIPCSKKGSKLFFNAETLEQWIESGKRLTKDEQLQAATENLSNSVKKSRTKAA